MENRGKTNELNTTSISKTALLERYGDHLEGSDFDDEQAREFLGALWQIMVAFVDVGVITHPLAELFQAVMVR